MAKRMPPEVLEYLRSVGKAYGKLGGKKAAKNMTVEQRPARAKKASLAAARKRTAQRLAREASIKQGKKAHAIIQAPRGGETLKHGGANCPQDGLWTTPPQANGPGTSNRPFLPWMLRRPCHFVKLMTIGSLIHQCTGGRRRQQDVDRPNG
jgi:hypothetical protein